MVNKITPSQPNLKNKKVLINNGRFRVVLRSQCNGGEKRKIREPPSKIASDMQKYLGTKKTHFYSHYIRPQKEILANLRPS